MLRKPLMLATAAGALIMVHGGALAQDHCDGIWAARCNLPKGPKPKSADKASATGVANANPNSAAATGTTGANAAVVAGAGALGASALGGISTGQSVKTSGGAALGTVSKIVKGPDGAVSQIIVTSAQGRSFPVAASKLSISGGAVIVTDSSD